MPAIFSWGNNNSTSTEKENAKQWAEASLIEVKFDFSSAYNPTHREQILQGTLQTALVQSVKGNTPKVQVSIDNPGRDRNKADVMSNTLIYFQTNAEQIQKQFPNGVLLDIRKLGDIGLNSDVTLLKELMQTGIIKGAKVASISSKTKHGLTSLKDKKEGLTLSFASNSPAKENQQLYASPSPSPIHGNGPL